MQRLALLLALLAPLAGCRTVSGWFDRSEHPLSKVDRDTAAANVGYAAEEFERGELDRAIERLIAVRELKNLTPETRLSSEELIDRAAAQAIAERGDDLDALEDLWDLELAPRMRARAGIRLAERLYETGHPVKSYKQVKDVEELLPNHAERARAGAVLAQAGLDLIANQGRYFLFLSYSARGSAALEFLVLTYPLDPACDRAYAALARYYERIDELELAIARDQDMILYRPRSPLAVIAAAEIPRLRLELIDSPDHDRGELLLAKSETRAWIERHPDHPLAADVRALDDRCRRRLAESDLVLSRYYRRIDNAFGARMHAERAAAEALSGGADELVREAEAILAGLGPAPAEASAVPAEAGPESTP